MIAINNIEELKKHCNEDPYLEVKIMSNFVGGYTMTNYYLCKAMYQMMAYDLCLKGEQS